MSKNTGTSELINYFDLGVNGDVGIAGSLDINTIANATTDTDTFLVSDTGIIKYRTGAQLLSDIGGQGLLTNPVTGTGTTNTLPKFTGSTTIGNSNIQDSGTLVTVGVAAAFSSTVSGSYGGTFVIPVESPASGNVALVAKTSNGANDIFRWFDGSTTLGVFKNNGNVLIGTTNDAGSNQPLQVVKSGSSNYLRLQADNNASYDCANFFTDGTNSVYAGMMRASSGLTGAYTIFTGGNNRFHVTSGGNVLIGTTTDNGAKLQVSGTATVSGNVTIGQATAGTNVKLIFNGVASKAAGIEFHQSGTPQWYIGNGIASEDNNFELYNSNGTMAMKIIKSTNAINFIGAATFSSSVTARNGSSGTAFITTNAVNADFTIETTSGGLTRIGTSGNNLAINSGGGNVGIGTTTINSERLTVAQTTGNASALLVYTTGVAAGQSYGATIIGGTNASDASFRVFNQGASINYFTVLGNGNVGINTPSPDANSKLDVNGQAFVGHLAIYNNNGTPSLGTSPMLYSPASGTIAISTNVAERMRITSGGNVLIGTTTNPGFKLYVSGSGNVVGITSSDNTLSLGLGTSGTMSGYLGASGSALYAYSTNGGYALLNSSSVWVAASDAKRKRNFEPYTNGISAILGLQPKLYNMDFQKDGDKKQVGLIAQEVKDFIPLAYEDNAGFIGLNYNAIIVTMVKAIQEQQVQIQELKNKLS